MVLIPEEAIQRYKQRQRLETSPLMGTMMHKDTQISDILQRDDVPDDEKQKLFNAYFERFLELRRQKETPTPVKKEEQRAEQQLPRCGRGGTHTQNHAPESHSAFISLESETRCDYVG